MKVIKSTNKRYVRYKGTSILEAAYVLIILLIITLAIIGFGWFFFRVQQITNAARHGARVAVRYNATEQDAIDAVDFCLDRVNLEHEVLPFSYDDGPDPNVADSVTVTVKGIGLDAMHLSSLKLLRIPIPDDFNASVTMAQEGPEY